VLHHQIIDNNIKLVKCRLGLPEPDMGIPFGSDLESNSWTGDDHPGRGGGCGEETKLHFGQPSAYLAY